MPRAVLRSATKACSYDIFHAAQPYPVDFIRSDQFSFILKAAPYYREAKAHDQLFVFLDSFFGLYFTLWPDKLPDNADFATIHSRHQKIRETVIFNLAMTSVFYVEITESWEEFYAERMAEHLARASKPIERDTKGRPRPRKLKARKNIVPIPADAEVILVEDSDDELTKAETKKIMSRHIRELSGKENKRVAKAD